LKGYIQVYTGDGKGKTTASLGLALRAAGAGLNVLFTQFIKQGDYSEIKILKKLDEFITVKQFGQGRFIKNKPVPEDIEAAQKGLKQIETAMNSGEYQVIIMDEANVAVACNLFPLQDLLNIIAIKPDNVELIITGRNAAGEVIEKADLVTEMRPVKHYYQKEIPARKGIEK
jgi:cob(I)alamin adenosyltransferase